MYTLEQFKKDFPAVEGMTDAEQKKAFGVFSAALENNPKMAKESAYKMATKALESNLSEHFHAVNFNTVALSEENTSTIEVLRVGVIRDRNLKITEKMLNDFVKNYEADVYGTELQVNLSHNRDGEAGGWIKELFIEGKKLMARVEWTPRGVEKLKNKLFKFVSAEFADRFPDHKTGDAVENVFIGLALTNVPALKGQSAVSLSEDIDLTKLNDNMFVEYITELNAREIVSAQDKAFAKAQFEKLSEDEQAENKEALEAVEAKPEEAPEEKPEEGKEEEGGEEKKEEEQPEVVEAPATPEALSESVKSLTTQLSEERAARQELADKLELTELSEQFEKQVMLSETKTTGLNATAKDRVIGLMKKLSAEDRAEFVALLNEVKTVDVTTHGSTATQELSETEAGLIEEATKLSQASGRPVHEELSDLYAAKSVEGEAK